MIRTVQANTAAWVKTEERLNDVESRQGTMVAHLDNISRAVNQTAEIMEQNRADRLAMEERERRRVEQAQADAREDAKDRKAIALRAGAELWSVFKQPLGIFVLAAGAYYAAMQFGIPVSPVPVEVQVVGDGQ